jgi:Glycosyl transferase family 2
MDYIRNMSSTDVLPPSMKVVVMSRNRPEFLLETLSSVIESAKLLSKSIICKIELSDNSDNDKCTEIVRNIFPQIKISSRRPNITSINHFKCVILEAHSDFLVVFHDDDVMKRQFLTSLYTLIINNPEVAAVGCNAVYMCNGVEINKTFLKQGRQPIIIDTNDKLLNGYFLIGSQGIAPLPGYMYRVKKMGNVDFNENMGGIHADVSFLFAVIARGPILWTPEVLMSYRLHESNESKQSRVSIKLNLLRYLNSQISKKSSQALRDFQYTIMLEWFRGQRLNIFAYYRWSNRQKIVFKHIFGEMLGHLFLRPECRLLHLRVLYEKASRLVAF